MHWNDETPLRVRKVSCSGAVHFMPAGAAVGGTPHLISIAPFASVRIGMLGAVQDPRAAGGSGVGAGAAGGFGICEGPPVVGADGGGAAGGGVVRDGPPVTGGCAGGITGCGMAPGRGCPFGIDIGVEGIGV